MTYLLYCDIVSLIKGLDGEVMLYEALREMAVGASHGGYCIFVAPEPEGRKLMRVEPSRDCCVNAYGLSDPESGDFLKIAI